jgi:Zn-dependent peptidase ImmA (M78 family)/transcriptional regulator with XRE-family HTH domain
MPFNGERLKQAREIVGLTQKELAEAAHLEQSYISMIEQNARKPSDSVVETLALTVGFPKVFLEQPSGPDFPLGSILFRRMSSLPSADIARIRQTARMVLEGFLTLQRRFRPLPVSIPRVGDASPVMAAQLARSALGYPPDGPVRGLMNRLEKAGVLVFRLPSAPNGFDAFSAWTTEREARPVMVLGQSLSGERDRATLAHELGHLVMHGSFLGDIKMVERQGVEFMGDFLLPEEDILQEFAGEDLLTLTRLAELKSKWGVSMQLILLRLEQLEIINAQKKSYWRGKLEKRDWLINEPVAIPTENPALLRQMFEKVYGAPVNARELARDLGIPARFCAEVLQANGRQPFSVSIQEQRQPHQGETPPSPPEDAQESKSAKPVKRGAVLSFRR